jgi:hypothetical protein
MTPPLPTVTVEVDATEHGVGKTVVASLIAEVLKRCGYEVSIEPVPPEELEGAFAATWSGSEVTLVSRLGRHLLEDVSRSHPCARVLIKVHG